MEYVVRIATGEVTFLNRRYAQAYFDRCSPPKQLLERPVTWSAGEGAFGWVPGESVIKVVMPKVTDEEEDSG